jgi:hypothetical protein
VNAAFSTERIIRLADGSQHRRPYYEILLDWVGEEHLTEITVLENSPLLGAVLLDGFSVQLSIHAANVRNSHFSGNHEVRPPIRLEMTTGGAVQIERL